MQKGTDNIALPLALSLTCLLSPIDDNAARTSRCDADRTLRLAAEPLDSALVLPQETFERGEASPIVLANPLFLFLAEHVLQHHTRLDGHARQPLEAQPALVWIGVLGLHVADDEDGFDPDAEFVAFVCLSRVRNRSRWMGYSEGATYNSRARW